MSNRPRTSKDFDNWFMRTGDPWCYYGKTVQRRLLKSVDFISKHIDNKFSGCFLEIGAYDGSFTKIISRSFPSAKIIANDISGVALSRCRETVTRMGFLHRTHFILKDILNFSNSDLYGYGVKSNEMVVLFLECLYYLKDSEQRKALKKIKKLLPNSQIVISGPVTGSPYFTEKGLCEMLLQYGYRMCDSKVLNFRKYDNYLYLLNNLRCLKFLSHQMIFLFEPDKKK